MLADVLHGYALATVESLDRPEALVSDLDGFRRALVSSDELRRVLTDSSVSPVARRSIVAELLEGRASKDAAGLISFTVRVELAGELPVALAELSELIGSEQLADAIAQPGAVRQRLRGYAERVLEGLSSIEAVDEIEDELFRLARVIETSYELRHVLTDPTASLTGRLAVMDDLLKGQTEPETRRLVGYVLRAGRLRNVTGTLDWLVELCAEERGRRVAEVRSAVPLEEGEQQRLAEALRRLSGREVEVRVLLDPDVVGGILISIGDLIIDGTVRLRIERLRDALVESA